MKYVRFKMVLKGEGVVISGWILVDSAGYKQRVEAGWTATPARTFEEIV